MDRSSSYRLMRMTLCVLPLLSCAVAYPEEDLGKQGGTVESTPVIAAQDTGVAESPPHIPVFGVVTAPMPITSFGVEGVDGAMVTAVAPQSAGALAGIRVGDILLRIDGKAVNEPDDVKTAVARVPGGMSVAVRLMRKARPVWVSVQF